MIDPDKNSLNEFEARLAALRPATPEIERDRLMYEAGWAAAEAQLSASRVAPRTTGWKLATAASSLAAAALLLLVVNRPAQPVAQTAVTRAPVDPPPVASTPEVKSNEAKPSQPAPVLRRATFATAPAAPYLALRHAAIAGRLDRMSPPVGRPADTPRPSRAPSTLRSLMEELLSDEGFSMSRT